MKRKKNLSLLTAVFASALAASSLTAIFLTRRFLLTQFQLLESFSQKLLCLSSEYKEPLLASLRLLKADAFLSARTDFLPAFGYRPSDFSFSLFPGIFYIFLFGLLLSFLLFAAVLLFQRRQEAARMEALTSYLEKLNRGTEALPLLHRDTSFSRLENELYKTVTMLQETKKEAEAARVHFADNLANIAHQLKTPIASASLSLQLLPDSSQVKNFQNQLSRLTHLEESLLLLARIDAGTLALSPRPSDVLTLLTMAGENLSELFSASGCSLVIPEMPEMLICVDPDWTLEALLNLLKNALEHTKAGGSVLCSSEQNLLYTLIRIENEGDGFAPEDLPHLFERFYRGQNAAPGGAGIGLSLAKELIEMQNGTLSACNLPSGNACFEIRFYCH